MLVDEFIQVCLQLRQVDLLGDIKGERRYEHGSGRIFAYAPRLQVEHGLLAQLPDGGAVAAFYVIGIDLQLRLGVDDGLGAEQQVVVLLKGILFFAHPGARTLSR